jgi:hypothetical protein
MMMIRRTAVLVHKPFTLRKLSTHVPPSAKKPLYQVLKSEKDGYVDELSKIRKAWSGEFAERERIEQQYRK